MPSLVTEPGFADPATALAHFERRLDVRGPRLYAAGHVAGAVNIPHRTMTAERMAQYPKDTAFVVYCAGPHCNGANKAAIRLARLGYPVKEMIGGITGWLDEEFALEPTAEPRAA